MPAFRIATGKIAPAIDGEIQHRHGGGREFLRNVVPQLRLAVVRDMTEDELLQPRIVADQQERVVGVVSGGDHIGDGCGRGEIDALVPDRLGMGAVSFP